jgi:hypothetical protein
MPRKLTLEGCPSLQVSDFVAANVLAVGVDWGYCQKRGQQAGRLKKWSRSAGPQSKRKRKGGGHWPPGFRLWLPLGENYKGRPYGARRQDEKKILVATHMRQKK